MNQTAKNQTQRRQKVAMSAAVLSKRRARLAQLDGKLRELFPDTHIALNHSSSWELLVAVMLSAQCTDKKVNEVTEQLFKKYTTLDEYCNVSQEDLEKDIHQTGFFRNKAKNVRMTAQRVRDVYGGLVPCVMEDLLTLPGVARKTANIVLGTVCGKVEGIAVDTHVKRFAIRFDLTDNTTPEKIEQDLMQVVPQKDWYDITYRIIEYGRQIAPARKYDTSTDPLVALYPPAGKVFRV